MSDAESFIEELGLPDDFDLTEIAPELSWVDPAKVAVSVLLDCSLEISGLTKEEVGRNGSVVLIEPPGDGWARLIFDRWKSWIRKNEQCETAAGRRSPDRSWSAWAVEGEIASHLKSDEEARFVSAVSRGRHCIGIARDTKWLPKDLVFSADFRLVIRPLSAVDVAKLTSEIHGSAPSVMMSDDQAASLTVRHLRLARRAFNGPDQYVGKLIDLLTREFPPPVISVKAAPSIREAPSLERLHGMDEAVAWGLDVARDLQAYRDNLIAWADVDRGCLLSGPPGVGKTLFAQALANTCGIPLICGSYSEWLGNGTAHQGDLMKSMRKTFATAKSQTPSLLFLDEVDSFPNRATISHHHVEWETQVVNGLLAEIDGVGGRDGVIILGACNHPDRLDPALVRSGRLDRHIQVELPNSSALESILREHLGSELDGESLSPAAVLAAGSSGADCEKYVRGARRTARQADRAMQWSDLIAEIGGGDDRSDADLWRAAVHEASHAVAMCDLQLGDLQAVSLRRSSDEGGRTTSAVSGGVFLAPDLHRRLTFMLAGRAGEEVVLGAPSSGAGGPDDSDLARATGLATMIVTALGMDKEIGLVWTGLPEPKTLSRMLASDRTVGARVRQSLDQAYSDALVLIRRRRIAVTAIAARLVERKALDGREVGSLIARHSVTLLEDLGQ